MKNLKQYFCFFILNILASSYLCPMRFRKFLYKLSDYDVSAVFAKCFIGVGNGKLKVGKNSFCNYHCFFDLSNNVTIGNNCSIAYGVTFVTSSHLIGNSEHRAGGAECSDCN